jgi:hypothetical protein
MAIEKAFLRQQFDRSREFVTLKAFLFSGQTIPSGQLFDKTTCSLRLLRQLYEGRYLRMATPEEEAQAKPEVKRVRFKEKAA